MSLLLTHQILKFKAELCSETNWSLGWSYWPKNWENSVKSQTTLLLTTVWLSSHVKWRITRLKRKLPTLSFAWISSFTHCCKCFWFNDRPLSQTSTPSLFFCWGKLGCFPWKFFYTQSSAYLALPWACAGVQRKFTTVSHHPPPLQSLLLSGNTEQASGQGLVWSSECCHVLGLRKFLIKTSR